MNKTTAERILPAKACAESILEPLVVRAEEHDPAVANLDVAAVGYFAKPEGGIAFEPLLPGSTRPPHWVSVANLVGSALPRGHGKGRAWLGQPELKGDTVPDFGTVLTEAWAWLVAWLQHHPNAVSPVLLHLGDGSSIAQLPELIHKSIDLITLSGRAPIRFHGLFGHQEPLDFPPLESVDEEDWNDWADTASMIASNDYSDVDGRLARALTRNRVRVVKETILRLLMAEPSDGTQEEIPPIDPIGSMLCQASGLCEVKRGNQEHECEDALALSEEGTRIAVCDGAGEGIFSRLWATLLAEHYRELAPDLGDRDRFQEWFLECRRAFVKKIDYANLRYTQQIKVDRTGAASTFVAWELSSVTPDGSARWRAWAIGDSCLFWVRAGQLLASFPLLHSGHFALAPALLRTKPGEPVPAVLAASGECRAGDVFVLATDAVAKRFLKDVEAGGQPDWASLEEIGAEDWHTLVERWRDEGAIENDDSSFAIVRVGTTAGNGEELA